MAESTPQMHTDDSMMDMNLRILRDVDNKQKTYLDDEQVLERECSHPCVYPVLDNIRALIVHTMDQTGNIAIKRLEEIHRKNPSNINTMENLDAIYRQMNRMTDSRRIQSDLEKLKNGEDRRYREEVARCKLEKAYVLLMDLHAETCKTPSVHLNEAQRALTHEIEHSQGTRQQSQKEAMQHIRVAKAAVAEAQKRLGALKTNCTLETKSGRDIAEKLFEKGIEEMEGLISRNNSLECEVLIWKHYFGKTCNRIGSTSRQELTTTEKKKYLRKAIDLFNEVITMLRVPENDGVCGMKKNEKIGIIVCLVRSYAYLGHILLLKDRIIAGNGQSPPESISDTFWKDPWSSFVKGLSLSKTHGCHDRVILNRLALTLLNVKKTADNEENNKEELENIDDNSKEELENLLAEMKRKNPWVKTTCPKKSPLQRDDTDFKNAEFLCRLSLHLWDYPNWFGHSVLMKVYMGWYRFQLDEYNESKKGKDRPTHELDKNLLRLAKLSGQNVLQSRITTDTLLDIAQVLYDSALKPGIGKDFRKTRVEDGKEILVCEALGYLQTAQDYHDCENHSRKHALLGQCLFDIGEKKKAIQYMKIAVGMERSNRDPINFETACRLIANGCETEKDKSSKKSKLKELWFMIDGNMRRYGKRLSYQLKGVANSYPHTVLEMLNLVKDEPEKYCNRTKQIFDTCLQTLLKHNGQRVKSRAEKLQKSLPEDMENVVFSLYDRFQERPGELQDGYPSDEPRTHGKKYDCYVHYSMADKDWVESFFLPCLKPEGPEQCKCLIRGSRCFDGAAIVRDCYRILVIVSKSFPLDTPCRTQMQELLRHVIGDKSLQDCIIPIARDEDVEVDELAIYELMDFTKIPYQLEKLFYVLQEIPQDIASS